MPELPEVETVRRGLAPAMEGARIIRAEINRPDLRRPFPPRMSARLEGARVVQLGRRSKYLLVGLDTGETLIVHLGMSGRMLVSGVPGEGEQGAGMPGQFHFTHPAPARHDHVVLHMESGARITFNDPRRFGLMDMCATAALEAHPLLAHLGPEPLGNGFNAARLRAAFAGKASPVKAALLDQRVVAGLGNIYVCEALHRAGISPRRAAGRISAARLDLLASAVRAVLGEAIEAGGSSLRDHRQASGELGYFQHAFRVYGRAGAPCCSEGCTGIIARLVQSGRSSFYCPRCQH